MKLLGIVHTDHFGEPALLNAIHELQVDWVSFELVNSNETAIPQQEKDEIPEQVINAVTSSADDVDIALFKRICYMYNFETRVRNHLKEIKVNVYNSDFEVPFLIGFVSDLLLATLQRDNSCIVRSSKESQILLDKLYDVGLSGRIAWFVALVFETSRSIYGDVIDRDYDLDVIHKARVPLAIRYRDYRTAIKLRELAYSNPNGLHVCGLTHIFGNYKNLAERLSHLNPSLYSLSDFH